MASIESSRTAPKVIKKEAGITQDPWQTNLHGLRVLRLDSDPPVAYILNGEDMVFVETSKFTQLVLKWLSEDEYRELQGHLSEYPEDGKQIKGTGGIRKIYWKRDGKGKLGGVRVIYYWVRKRDVILMLFLYPKSMSADLSPEQRKILKKIVEEEYP